MRIILQVIVFLMIFSIATSARSEVKVERIDYKGWTQAYKLSNGSVDLIFVPQIGRIMHFGWAGDKNLIWENAKFAGKTVDLSAPGKDWMNFGGDKLWNAPQDRWGWPPDPAIDAGNVEVEVLPDHALRITGKTSSKHGIRFIREIELDPTGPGVTLTNAIENVSKADQEWSVWQVCQVISPEYVAIPASPKGSGFYAFPDNPPDGAHLSWPDGEIRLKRNSAKPAKIGSDSRAGWVKALIGDTFITLRVPKVGDGKFPHGGSVQEAYTNTDPDAYIEMEVASPIQKLKPGARYTYLTRLELSRKK